MKQKAEQEQPQATINRSGLRPLGRTVLVEPYEPEVKRGMIVIPATVSERTMQAEMRCVVIAVGEEAWKEEKSPRAKAGDKVLVSKYAGTLCQGTLDGKLYRVVNANDIFLQIAVEAEVAEEAA